MNMLRGVRLSPITFENCRIWSVDTNRDTNPGALLWTTMDGLAEIDRKFGAERRLWTPVDKGKQTPKPQVARSISVPSGAISSLFDRYGSISLSRANVAIVFADGGRGHEEPSSQDRTMIVSKRQSRSHRTREG